MSLESSRSQPTAGEGVQIIAELRNVSESTIYLHERSLILFRPPELEEPFQGATFYYAAFATEQHTAPPQDDPNGWYSASISLRPGDSYRASFSPRAGSGRSVAWFEDAMSQVKLQLKFIFFPPGDYKVTAVAKYWTDPSLPPNDYRSTAQSIVLRVAAPQFVILLGAAIGGLIAYIVFPQIRQRAVAVAGTDTWSATILRLSREVVGATIAVLLSAIFTIVLSRMSESQFPIRVTVTDFWGGMAIGFVAGYGGSKILEKVLGPPSQDATVTDSR